MLLLPSKHGPAHNVVVPAFVGNELKLYTIYLAFLPDGKSYAFDFAHHEMGAPISAKGRARRIGLAGSGAACLLQDQPKGWKRRLLGLVKAHSRGRVSSRAVADHLAHLNSEVHARDTSVGLNCVVVWRHRNGWAPKDSAADQFYVDGKRDRSSAVILPSIGNGMDLRAMFELMVPYVFNTSKIDEGEQAKDPLDNDEFRALWAALPREPDELLR